MATTNSMTKHKNKDKDCGQDGGQDPSLTILSIQSELHNMGKSLSCPLCLSTLRNPSLLPCNHVFCHSCITTAFQPQHNRIIDKESGKHTFKNACPVCKASCTKRSIVPADGLKDLIRGYKHALRSFGFAPVVFDPKVNLGMTQLEDTIMYSDDFDDDGDDNGDKKEEEVEIEERTTTNNRNRNANTSTSSANSTRNSKDKNLNSNTNTNTSTNTSAPSLRQCHEHLEVSRGIHRVLKKVTAKLGGSESERNTSTSTTRSKLKLKRASDPNPTMDRPSSLRVSARQNTNIRHSHDAHDTHRPIISVGATREEMDRRTQLRKMEHILQDQEKVVQVNERALVRAAVKKHKKSASASANASVASGNSSSASASRSVKNDDANKSKAGGKRTSFDASTKGPSKSPTLKSPPASASASTSTSIENNDHNSPDSSNSFNGGTASQFIMVERAMQAMEKTDEIIQDAGVSLGTCGSAGGSQSQNFFDTSTGSIPLDEDKDVNENENSMEQKQQASSSTYSHQIMTSQDVMEDAIEKEMADRSGEWFEQEVEMEERRKSGSTISSKQQQAAADNTSQPFFSARSEMSQALLLLDNASSKQQADDAKAEAVAEKATVSVFSKGNIVRVQNRTWPGVNKPGGVARISKVHSGSDGSDANASTSTSSTGCIKYDVIYVLGGREKMVDGAFVELHKDLDVDMDVESSRVATASASSRSASRSPRRSTRSRTPVRGSTSTSARTGANANTNANANAGTRTRKSRRVDEKKQVEQWIAEIDAQEMEKEQKQEGKINEKSKSNASKNVKVTGTRSSSRPRRSTSKLLDNDDDDAVDENSKISNQSKSKTSTAKISKSEGTKARVKSGKAKAKAKAKQTAFVKKAKGKTIEKMQLPNSNSNQAGTTTITSATATATSKRKRKSSTVKESNSEDAASISSLSKTETTTAPKKKRKRDTPIEPEPIIINMPTTFFGIFETAIESYMPYFANVNDPHPHPTNIFITTSGLKSAEDKKLIKNFCTQLSKVNSKVKVKQLKDFNPYKTTILVTAISKDSTNGNNSGSGSNGSGETIASLRTMKTMRAALAGIPLVSSDWLQACMGENQILPPTPNQFVTALPPRTEFFANNYNNVNVRSSEDGDGYDLGDFGTQIRNQSTAVFGVPTLAAALAVSSHSHRGANTNTNSNIFTNLHVCLCGSDWKTKTTMAKDVQLLLREGGASMLTSSAKAVKFIQEELGILLQQEQQQQSKNNHFYAPSPRVILLCDGNESDGACGITSTLAKAVRQFYTNSKTHASSGNHPHPAVLTVHSKWIFDSISCAEALGSDHFAPNSPLATSLWKLCRT